MGAMASLGSRDLTGKIYVGDHQTLFHTEYITCGPHGLRAKYFFMGDIDPSEFRKNPENVYPCTKHT